MNRQKLRGRWDETKGFAREFWGELSGDDLNFIAGQRDRLIGRLERKYNLSRSEAEMQVEIFERKVSTPQASRNYH